jgi:hypothetical protein
MAGRDRWETNSAETERLAGTRSMITLEDCVGLCGLTEEEVLAVAEHEHLPEVAATAFAQYLLSHDQEVRSFGI